MPKHYVCLHTFNQRRFYFWAILKKKVTVKPQTHLCIWGRYLKVDTLCVLNDSPNGSTVKLEPRRRKPKRVILRQLAAVLIDSPCCFILQFFVFICPFVLIVVLGRISVPEGNRFRKLKLYCSVLCLSSVTLVGSCFRRMAVILCVCFYSLEYKEFHSTRSCCYF